MIWIVIAALAWIVPGWIACAGELAWWQHRYPTFAEREYRSDLGFCLFLAFFPIVGPIAMCLECGFFQYGFNWRLERPSEREKRLLPEAHPSPIEPFQFWWKEPWRK